MCTEELDATYFLDENGNSLGDRPGILPIPLYKGMMMTISKMGKYEVVDWNYCHGHPDEMGGLRIILRLTL